MNWQKLLSRPLDHIIFLLVIFCIPFQVGKHFWPDFSYIKGVRIDYLSPTLHPTDILIGLLFIIVVLQLLRSKTKLLLPLSLAILIISLISQVFFVELVKPHVFGVVTLCEMLFFGWYTSRVAFTLRKPIITLLITGALASSFIAMMQLINQGSIGGPLYYLGERSFTSSTIGIATIHIRDSFMLRPYATFPHPNVLAFFLFLVSGFVTHAISQKKDTIHVPLLICLAVIHIGILITYSRVILIMYGFFIVYGITRLWGHKKSIRLPVTLIAIGIGILFINTLLPRFLDSNGILRDASYRIELFTINTTILQGNIFGVGLNNHFFAQEPYQKIISPTLFQPVHNIYLLTLVQLGVMGSIPVAMFVIETLKRLQKAVNTSGDKEFFITVRALIVALLIVGLFDHFLITVHQGQLLTAFLFGLAWSKTKAEGKG